VQNPTFLKSLNKQAHLDARKHIFILAGGERFDLKLQMLFRFNFLTSKVVIIHFFWVCFKGNSFLYVNDEQLNKRAAFILW